jgi:hypothetical protein
MLKSLISIVSKHAGHVLLGGLLAHITGLAGLIGSHIPATVVTGLAAVGVTINPALLATAIATGVTNYLEKFIPTGSK